MIKYGWLLPLQEIMNLNFFIHYLKAWYPCSCGILSGVPRPLLIVEYYRPANQMVLLL